MIGGKLGAYHLGEFKLGDSPCGQQPPGGGGGIGGPGHLIGKRVLDDEWIEDEEAMLLVVLSQL